MLAILGGIASLITIFLFLEQETSFLGDALAIMEAEKFSNLRETGLALFEQSGLRHWHVVALIVGVEIAIASILSLSLYWDAPLSYPTEIESYATYLICSPLIIGFGYLFAADLGLTYMAIAGAAFAIIPWLVFRILEEIF